MSSCCSAWIAGLAAVLALGAQEPRRARPVLIVGELDSERALLQVRLDEGRRERPWWIELREAGADAFRPVSPGPLTALARHDGILRVPARDLSPATRYEWRARSGEEATATASFRTLPGPARAEPVRLAVVTGLNQARFEAGFEGDDKVLGYPGLAALRASRVHVVVFTGDSVYYDHPREGRATTLAEMRAKWRSQLELPRFRELLSATGTWWMKDDHDHRFNDCDTTGEQAPSSDLGIAVFREQVPVVRQGDAAAPTYRRHRASKDLEVWLVEGRDHRDANALPDGPEKSLWGEAQLAWLRDTLLASDATFRVLVSPTPLVGPDDAYKRDNHTNPRGFRAEGEAFHAWARENDLPAEGFVVLCGDRHWQYHSVHPSGVQEFSCGALVDANARLGRAPGDEKSTDPDALVQQPFVSPEATGGFLLLDCLPATDEAPARLVIRLCDERGTELYRHEERR